MPTKEALGDPHRIHATAEEIALLAKAFMDSIKTQLQDSNISWANNS